MKTCNAKLEIGDDFGDGTATMRCQKQQGHKGCHMERFLLGDVKKVTVTWFDEKEKDAEVERLNDGLARKNAVYIAERIVDACFAANATKSVSKMVAEEEIAKAIDAALAERIKVCENCGGSWVDDGINSGCFCREVKRLKNTLELASLELCRLREKHGDEWGEGDRQSVDSVVTYCVKALKAAGQEGVIA